MELGTGVVIATVLAIAAWQIDKRQAWKKARNLVLSLVGLTVLGALGVWGYVSYENYQQAQITAKEVEAIRSGKLKSLADAQLGQDRAQVLYAWGQPVSEQDQVLNWKGSGAEKAVMLSDTGKVRVILCSEGDSAYSYGCGNVAGLSIGDSERQVTEALGPPTKPAQFDGVEKTLFYGSKTGMDIVLKGDKITRFVLFESRDKTRSPQRKSVRLSEVTGSKFGGEPVIDPNEVKWDQSQLPPGHELENDAEGE